MLQGARPDDLRLPMLAAAMSLVVPLVARMGEHDVGRLARCARFAADRQEQRRQR